MKFAEELHDEEILLRKRLLWHTRLHGGLSLQVAKALCEQMDRLMTQSKRKTTEKRDGDR